MSYFFYKERDDYSKVKKFIERYLPQYSGIDLYDILRNPLVHNYSIKKNYSLSSDPLLCQYGMSILSNGIIFIPSLIKDLEFAVDRAIKDLREDKTIRAYAIQWEKRHQILELNQSEVAIFTEPEIERLKSEYISLIKQHPVFAPESAEFVEISIISRPLPNNNFEALIEN